MVLKSDRGLPRVPFLKLHPLHCRLEEAPQHASICNRGGGEDGGYRARGPSHQEHDERSCEGKQGQQADEWEVDGGVIHPLCPSSRKRASAATAAPNNRR